MERLRGWEHAATAPELPLHDAGAGYRERVRPAIEALEGVEDPVIVVAHSQSSALGPLIAVARPVSLLVYLCPRMGGFEPPEGAPKPFRKDISFPPPRPDGSVAWDPQVAIEVMYPRVPPEMANALADHLRPMAMPRDDYPLREHPDVRTALVYTTEDELFEPAFERFMAREMLAVEPIELQGGHFPMAEDPSSVAALLNRLAQTLPAADSP